MTTSHLPTAPGRSRRCPALLAALAVWAGSLGNLMQAATDLPARARVFDMDGRQVLQDEDQLGIVNGRLAAGINYRDVAGIAGLWAPPFVSANFNFDARANGAKVPTTHWTWRPFQVEREGRFGEVKASSTTTLIHGHRAAIVSFVFNNTGRSPATLDLFTLGWLDQVQDWGFSRPASGKEATAQTDGRRLQLRQGDLSVTVATDSPAWRWEASGNLGHATCELAARKTQSVNVIITIGSDAESRQESEALLAAPQEAVEGACREYTRQVDEMFTRLPRLESDNTQLVRWYQRSLVHLIMNRWDVPEFVLHPYYSTGSVKGGCVANYLWNFGEVWEILPLFDPAAAKTHIRQFLQCDLLKHFLFNPITGKADGVWYMINQEKIIGLTYYYVLLTGDTAFLDELVDGKSIRDHMVIQAMFGDDVTKPIALIDYGPSNSHLELRRRYGYRHVMPDLNARRYANYQRAAALCELAGKPDPSLRPRAELLKPLLKERLWDPKARWFRYQEGDGHTELRYTVQMFKPIDSGVLDAECEDGILSHLNEREFLSREGLHSLSKQDPAYDQLDIDNGGGGICTSFPPQIIEKLYLAGHPELAADVLRRLLWWGETMPYWGDSIAANCKDYRRDTPLQCTLDGAAAAQCVIFGVFGISVSKDEIRIHPNPLPYARRLALKGLHIRGQTLDVELNGADDTVTSGGRRQRSERGQPVIIPIGR